MGMGWTGFGKLTQPMQPLRKHTVHLRPLMVPDIPANVMPVNGQYRLHFWVSTTAPLVALNNDYGENDLPGYEDGVPYTIGITDGTRFAEHAPRRDTDGVAGLTYSAIIAGELVATQPWVTTQIANIMLSGGGVTIPGDLIASPTVGYPNTSRPYPPQRAAARSRLPARRF